MFDARHKFDMSWRIEHCGHVSYTEYIKPVTGPGWDQVFMGWNPTGWDVRLTFMGWDQDSVGRDVPSRSRGQPSKILDIEQSSSSDQAFSCLEEGTVDSNLRHVEK